MQLQQRFEQAAKLYRPDRLRLLFISEAPPAYKANRLFYFTGLTNGDTLFLEMMKVLYPLETGYSNNTFEPGFSVKLIRNRKLDLLRKFQRDGFYLIDAYEQPMPDGANRAAKTTLMRGALPALKKKVRRLVRGETVPVILIGAVTYSVCADALRQDGEHVANHAMMNHPARGGQKLFRAKLKSVIHNLGYP